MVSLQLGRAWCGDVPLVHFGLPRCSVTIKPLLLLVTVLYGKSLGPEAKIFGEFYGGGRGGAALAAAKNRT
jgi:hypothetical protein